jgi:hypothetical protein
MCSGSCSVTSPLSQFLKNTSPQALAQVALKPKDPLDPKQLLAALNPLDPASSTGAATRGPKVAGTGLLVDTSV